MLDNITKQYAYGKKPVADLITGVHIGEIHNPDTLAEMYVVYVRFMHGDADSYDTEEVYFALGDEERMLEFLNFLSRCSVRYCNGKGGRDSYNDVPGYSRWVEDEDFNEDDWEDLDDEELEAKREEFEESGTDDQILHWPFWEGEWCASYDSAYVVYFNEQGIRHTVKMSTEA